MEHSADKLFNVLAQVSNILAAKQPTDQTLYQLVGALCDGLKCPAAGLWLYRLSQRTLERTVHQGFDNPELAVQPVDGPTVLGAAARELKTITTVQGHSSDASLAGFQACMAAPLIWQGQFYGVLVAADSAPSRSFLEPDAQVIEWIARQAAAVIASQQAGVHTGELEQALETEREWLLHVQVAIRQMLDEPSAHANLNEMAEALQALGWQRSILALFDDSGRVRDLICGGIEPEEVAKFRECPVPFEVWGRFLGGDLENYRRSGVYFVPHGDPTGKTWDAQDVIFAPLQVAQKRVMGVIRVDLPVTKERPDWDALRPLDILAGQTAYIVENARLLDAASRTSETLAQQVEELSMMHRADRELSSNLDISRIMRLTMDWALRRTGADTGLLMLMTDDKRGLVPFVVMGYVDRTLFVYNEYDPMPVDRGIIGRAARLGRTQLVQQVTNDPDYIPFVPNTHVFVAIPISMRGETLGVLTLIFTQARTFEESDVSFLERLGRRAAVALDNAHLFRQSEQMADDMALLYSASQVINSSLERGEVLQRIAQAMTVTLECSSTVICDYQPESQQSQVLVVYKLGTEQDTHEILPSLGYSISLADYPAFQTAIDQRHPLALRAADASMLPLDREHLLRDKIFAMVLVPLVSQGEIIGIATIIEGRHDRIFTTNEVFKAENLAAQAAVALRQAQLYSEVLELEKLKSEMIRMASHDLRNPLNNIMGYVELMAMSIDAIGMTPDQEQYVDNLRRSSQAMRQLLEDLLTLERIESERQSEWQLFDLSGLVLEVVEAQQSSADLKRQTLIFTRLLDTPPVRGSVTQLRQAIANLVGNAVKYTPEEGRIEVTCEFNNNQLKFAVRDNGYGISPERQVRIFERFYRAREPGTDHIGGTGLGLSLVKTVIERHGGQVWFNSETGIGSVFGFWLPPAE